MLNTEPVRYSVDCITEKKIIHGHGSPQEVCPTDASHPVHVGSLKVFPLPLHAMFKTSLSVTGTLDIDCNWQPLVIWNIEWADDGTLTFSRFESGSIIIIRSKQDASDGNTVAWPAGYEYIGKTAPAPTPTANRVDTYIFYAQGGILRQALVAENMG